MLDFGFYNMDCMQGMKEFPDNYFDLAIVDPPYGDGGGTWTNRTRFGERFDRYAGGGASRRLPRQDLRRGGIPEKQVERTGGTWATKFGQKLLRGTLHRGKNTSTNFSAFHAVKSYGGGIIFHYPRRGALSYGVKRTYPKSFQWQWPSTHGLHLMRMQRCSTIQRSARTDGFTRHKSRWPCISGYFRTTPNQATKYSIHTLAALQV